MNSAVRVFLSLQTFLKIVAKKIVLQKIKNVVPKLCNASYFVPFTHNKSIILYIFKLKKNIWKAFTTK